jgi:translation initiation factor 3 subunit L
LYVQLFERILNSSDRDFMITTPWIYDIMQEFAYQFQGFCQYRSLTVNQNAENLELLRQNNDAWNLPETFAILTRLISVGKAQSGNGEYLVLQQFGYFASIELARLECLLGDYQASLQAISTIRLYDRTELFNRSPICHFNLLYHIGVSQFMLTRFEEALITLSDSVLLVIGLSKPGAGQSLRPGVPSQLNRMMEKALSLLAILISIVPHFRVEDTVRVAVEGKFDEKMKKILAGDDAGVIVKELFEAACPKFISPFIPDYTSGMGPGRYSHDVFDQQVKIIVDKVIQYVPFLKLRNFLSMYTSINLTKLSTFSGISEAELASLLLSFKLKAQTSPSHDLKLISKATNAGQLEQDLHFYINGGLLIIDRPPFKQDTNLLVERAFTTGILKQREVLAHLNKTFADLKL